MIEYDKIACELLSALQKRKPSLIRKKVTTEMRKESIYKTNPPTKVSENENKFRESRMNEKKEEEKRYLSSKHIYIQIRSKLG